MGINIQWPWSQLLLSGEKTVETRNYPLPKKHVGRKLALIETPGKSGHKAGITKARIIGFITFSSSFSYPSVDDWVEDFARHRVPTNHGQFRPKEGVTKWGWLVEGVTSSAQKLAVPARRGIIFATCQISL